MADKKIKTQAELYAETKAEVADITDHTKAELKPYVGVDADYMNYSSVARKPFAATESDDKDPEPEDATPQAPKAPGITNK